MSLEAHLQVDCLCCLHLSKIHPSVKNEAQTLGFPMDIRRSGSIRSSWLQRQPLMKRLLSPQFDMDVRDEEVPHSSSVAEAQFNVTPAGQKAEINFLNFKNA